MFVTQVKGNQPSLTAQIHHGCRVQSPIDTWKQEPEKAHGRLETRQYEVFDALPMLDKWQIDWPFIRRVIRVTRTQEILQPKSKSSQEVSYYVTNALENSATTLGTVIRNHWAIENTNHYVRDVVFKEDDGMRRVNPGIFSILISTARNLVATQNPTSITTTIYKYTLDFQFMIGQLNSFLG